MNSYQLEVVGREPAPHAARVRLPEGADIRPRERDHALHVIMCRMGADAREVAPGDVVGLAEFSDGWFVGFDQTDCPGTHPTSLAEFAEEFQDADGGSD